ncbi:MAG: class I SAM-dependent methyltransferase [Verrucomicrobia bacterium]|nr:class I SAM-dependent methyltransferase [Verrucomicrobiota bacterium]
MPCNPYRLKSLPFYSLRRLVSWTVPNRYWRLYAHLANRPFDRFFDRSACQHFLAERGTEIADTAVTTNQRDLLLRSVAETEQLAGPIVEIGCYRGATTRTIAQTTRKQVIAVDPYARWDGAEAAYAKFLEETATLPNVRHLRQSSGDAALALTDTRFSLVFIDAIHDYMNTWFDFVVWGERLLDGGLIAFHDVDDWRGTNVACQKILTRRTKFVPWAYCPNLVVFRKVK